MSAAQIEMGEGALAHGFFGVTNEDSVAVKFRQCGSSWGGYFNSQYFADPKRNPRHNPQAD